MARLNDDLILKRPDGCDVAERCLECPLSECRYESPTRWSQRLRQAKDYDISQRCGSGQSVAEIAASMGMSRRTVLKARYRYELEQPEFTPEELQALLLLVYT